MLSEAVAFVHMHSGTMCYTILSCGVMRTSVDLYRLVLDELGFPSRLISGVERKDGAHSSGPVSEYINLGARQAEQLRSVAQLVGIPPADYPLHVRLVMKSISALLPWYTRPIRSFCLEAASLIGTMHGALQEAQERILRLEREVERLRRH